jgi:sec-independent protein translocase protein TatA
MGPLGWQETVFIFVLALLVFGPKKLPELGRTIGKALTEFRRASSDLKATFDREMKSLEQEGESLREITRSYQNDLYDYDSSNYDSSYNYEDGSYESDSHDSTASNPSTVGASATEGAESTTSPASESGVATATKTTEEASAAESEAVAGSGHPSKDPKAPGLAGGTSAPES